MFSWLATLSSSAYLIDFLSVLQRLCFCQSCLAHTIHIIVYCSRPPSLRLSVSLPLYLSLVPLPLSVSPSLPLSLSICLFLSLSLCVTPSQALPLCVRSLFPLLLSLSLFPSPSLPHPSVYHSLSVCFHSLYCSLFALTIGCLNSFRVLHKSPNWR